MSPDYWGDPMAVVPDYSPPVALPPLPLDRPAEIPLPEETEDE